jgi:hypothetical protein
MGEVAEAGDGVMWCGKGWARVVGDGPGWIGAAWYGVIRTAARGKGAECKILLIVITAKQTFKIGQPGHQLLAFAGR